MSHILISSRLPSPPILSSPLLSSSLILSLLISFCLFNFLFSSSLIIFLFSHYSDTRGTLWCPSPPFPCSGLHAKAHILSVFLSSSLLLSALLFSGLISCPLVSSCLVLSDLPSHTLPLITSLSSSSFLSSCLFFFSSRLLFFSLSSPRLMSSHFILPPSSLLFAHPFSYPCLIPFFFSPCILSSSPDDAETPWNLCFHSVFTHCYNRLQGRNSHIIHCGIETVLLRTNSSKLAGKGTPALVFSLCLPKAAAKEEVGLCRWKTWMQLRQS